MGADVGLVGDHVCPCCVSPGFLYWYQEVGSTRPHFGELSKLTTQVNSHVTYSRQMSVRQAFLSGRWKTQTKFAFDTVFITNSNKRRFHCSRKSLKTMKLP